MTSAPSDNNRSTLLVHAYVDGELDPVNAVAIEQQIAADPKLSAEKARIDALRRTLRDKLPATEVPAGLDARIRNAVGIGRPSRTPSWRAMAASIVVATAMSSAATWLVTRSATDDVLEAAVGGHLRALMAPQPIDIASSEGHVVKPWFNGRVPQAPRLVDLTQAGFRLVGGRIDVVERAGVPTLVYQIRQHLISVTAVPEAGARPAPVMITVVRGYNVARWSDDDVSYLAISDLNATDLMKFVQAFRPSPPAR
jgi:anti-sigma factor RsiW